MRDIETWGNLASDALTRVLCVLALGAVGMVLPGIGIPLALIAAAAFIVEAVTADRSPSPAPIRAVPVAVETEAPQVRDATGATSAAAPATTRRDRVGALLRLCPLISPLEPGASVSPIEWSQERIRFSRADLVVCAVILIGAILRIHGAFVGGDVADVNAYSSHFERVRRGLPIYEGPGAYPYLPGWLGIEILVGQFSVSNQIPYWQLVRMLVVAGDIGLTLAIWWLATRLRGRSEGRIAAALYALCPIAVLIAGYQGMFDPLPILLCVLASGLILRPDRRVIVAGILLGAAITLKPLAGLVAPVLFLRRGLSMRERWLLAAAASLVVILVCLPIVIGDPPALFRNVLGYGGVNDGGLGGLLRAFWMTRTKMIQLPGEFGQFISNNSRLLALALMAFTVLIGLRQNPMRCAAGVYLAFLGTFGAVSTQYLLWPVGFMLVSDLGFVWPTFYGLAVSVGAIGFYLVFWQPIIFGSGAPGLQPGLAPQFLVGQLIAFIGIWVTYGVAIAEGIRRARWRSPMLIAVAILVAVGSIPVIKLVIFLVQEWIKAPWT